MTQQPPNDNSNWKEPYPNFIVTFHELMLGQIEYTRLRILIIRIVFGIAIATIIINIVLCLLTALLPLFGISVYTWLVRQIQIAPGWSN